MRLPLALCVLVLLASAWWAAPARAEGLSEYRLGVGDRIQVLVYDEPDLSLEYTLSDAGTISYPFLGELVVKGLTIGELERRITDGLKGPYLVDPKVNVTIKEYRPFFILGEVRNAGGYPYQPGLTLGRAVGLAGGLGDKAAEKHIEVIRDGDPGRRPQPISMDDPVHAGDTVTVGKGFF